MANSETKTYLWDFTGYELETSWKVLLAAKKKRSKSSLSFLPRWEWNNFCLNKRKKVPEDKVRIRNLIGEWRYITFQWWSGMEYWLINSQHFFQQQKAVAQYSCSLPVRGSCTKRHTAPARFFGTVPYMTQTPRRNIRAHYTKGLQV